MTELYSFLPFNFNYFSLYSWHNCTPIRQGCTLFQTGYWGGWSFPEWTVLISSAFSWFFFLHKGLLCSKMLNSGSIYISGVLLCVQRIFSPLKKKKQNKIVVNEWSRSSPSFLLLLNQILGLRLKTAFCSSSQTVRLKMWVSDYWWHNEKELLSFMRARCFVAKDCLNASSKDKCMQEEKGL